MLYFFYSFLYICFLLLLSCNFSENILSNFSTSIDISDISFSLEKDITPPIVTSVPYGGTFMQNISVSFQSNEVFTKIYYTLDGSKPTVFSNLWQEGDPFIVLSKKNTRLQYFGIDRSQNSTIVYTSGYSFLDNPIKSILNFSLLHKNSFLISETQSSIFEWFFFGNNSIVNNVFLNEHTLDFEQKRDSYHKSFSTVVQGNLCFVAWNQIRLYFNSYEYMVLQVYRDEQAPYTQINISVVEEINSKNISLFNFEKSIIWYRLDGETSFRLYTDSFIISQSTIIEFYATDISGNQEVLKRTEILVEKALISNRLLQLEPFENSFFQNHSVTFSWRHFYKESENIHLALEVSTDFEFTNIMFKKDVTELHMTKVRFEEIQRYYYRFRIFGVGRTEIFSPIRTFCIECVRYDVNNDGFSDFLISAPGYDIEHEIDEKQGKIYLYFGSLNIASESPPDITFKINHHHYVGLSTEIVEDLNKDNISDIMISSQGQVFIFYGGPLLSLKCKVLPCQLSLLQADRVIFQNNTWGLMEKSIFQSVFQGQSYTSFIDSFRDINTFTDNGVFCLYDVNIQLQNCSSVDIKKRYINGYLIDIHNLLGELTSSIAVRTTLSTLGENHYSFFSRSPLKYLEEQDNVLLDATLISNTFDFDKNGMFDVFFVLNNQLFLQQTFRNSKTLLKILDLSGMRNSKISVINVGRELLFFLLCSPEKENFSGVCLLYSLDRDLHLIKISTLKGRKNSYFGYHLYQIGDVNGGGLVDFLISAPYETNKFLQGGSAYILLTESISSFSLEENVVANLFLRRLIGEGDYDYFGLVISGFE